MCLHEGDGFVGSFDVVGQVGADFWGDEFLLIGLRADAGVELVDGCVAEGAVQVEVELDLWEAGDVHGLGL